MRNLGGTSNLFDRIEASKSQQTNSGFYYGMYYSYIATGGSLDVLLVQHPYQAPEAPPGLALDPYNGPT